MGAELESLTLPGAGVRLHVVAAGPRDGRPVVLLHGFPEFWYGWRHQVGPLADAGFRVYAPDQRGYNASDRPQAVADYTLDKLADDVTSVLDALGLRKAAVVGHDWGGGVAWWLALTHPEHVERMVVMNCPHPEAFARTLWSDLGQLTRSWYMFAFQLPRLPERGFARHDFRSLVKGMRKSSRPGTFTAADFDAYKAAWAQPGALTGMVNWYRAAAQTQWPRPRDPRVRVPALVIWGARDRFLKTKLAKRSVEFCDRGRLELLPTATHWLQHEEPERVNRLLIDFLNEGTS